MPRQVFTAGEILTAANMNDLSDQTVMVFDTSAARGSAIPTPSEGMVTYLKDTNALEKFDGSAFVNVNTDSGKILQVVSANKTDAQTTTSTSFVDVTDLSVSITPSSVSNDLLVMWSVHGSNSDRLDATLFVVTDGSNNILLEGDTVAGKNSTLGVHLQVPGGGDSSVTSTAGQFVTSPATTSAYTVKVRFRVTGSTGSVNRSGSDGVVPPRTVSNLTVMEVAG